MTQQYNLPGRVADIGARIKKARIAIDLSQEDFALRMGRTGRHWAWKVEAGQIGLSAGEIPKAAEMLGHSVQWLIEGREEVFEVEDPHIRLFFRQHEWSDFTDEEQEIIRQSMRMAAAYKAAREQSSTPAANG
jgi:transcriptional regulator with XRE-family HTH domain